ncbi:MAG TPA: hypothetical protein VNM67_14035 [Thermoanaerobaculia bacterium]|nr:hypothetical protein [Thermoanaerobaculia bacterium]
MARTRQPSQNSESSPADSPTLPLPPPRAASIPLEQFIEAVSVSALRSLASARAFNPQPDPPRTFPQPWIWVGIVASYGDLPTFAGGPNVAGKGGGQ